MTPTPASNPDSLIENDPDLAAIVEAWPGLPEPFKAGISAMVNAANGKVNETEGPHHAPPTVE